MKISVITPSFNQAQFLPVNLASVKSQKGVEVEHIIIDPGSTDGSTEIARQAEGIILINEPDRGQSDGINKGFMRATGDILVWLNSDDFYPDDGVLMAVAECFEKNKEIDIVYGGVNFVGENGEFLRKGFVNSKEESLLDTFQYQVGIVQPGVFWRRKVFEEIGGPSEEFEYCMDYELWVRMASSGFKWKYVSKVLAHHRWWDGMKTSSRRDLSLKEHFRVCDRYFGYIHWKWLERYAEFLCTNQDGVVNHAKDVDAVVKRETLREVIDHVLTQEMMKKISSSVHPDIAETWKFIQDNYPEKSRVYFTQDELNIVEEVSDDPKGLQRVAWNVFKAKSKDELNFSAYHVPDNFDRYFLDRWHRNELVKAESGLERMREQRRGDTCVIVGNGPSLHKSNLALLENVDTIISNFAVMSPQLNQHAKILTVVNDLVAKQGAVEFNTSAITKVVPFWLGNYFTSSENTFFVNATVKPEFGFDFVNAASWRSTVSFFNMQLAYALGYTKVVLIGFDHSYVQPKGVVEGVVISQKEDDENHFDPRYFKGKDWQAADTDNMEKMYCVAREAYKAHGREIVNCTVGGRLEVFRRSTLEKELGVAPASFDHGAEKAAAKYPRLLMIDSTPSGHPSATGQLKQLFLQNWPKESFLQVWEKGGTNTTLHLYELGQSIESSRDKGLKFDEVLKKCQDFNPDVIYYRPIDSMLLSGTAEKLFTGLKKPLAIHMMDDWPQRLKGKDYKKYLSLDSELRKLVAVSSSRLSICETMSRAYQVEYGGTWIPLANGVDVEDFDAKDWSKKPAVSKRTPFIIRYMGGLAEDMTDCSVKEIAEAVADLHDDYHVRFEIYTMDWYLDKAKKTFAGLKGVSVNPLVAEKEYRQMLCSADALVIAYNFDQNSLKYIGLSLANKMPECLASGAVLLAYGPMRAATIEFLSKTNCVKLITERNYNGLKDGIKELVTSPSRCSKLTKDARAFAKKNLSKEMVQTRFLDCLNEACLQKQREGELIDEMVCFGKGVQPYAAFEFIAANNFVRLSRSRWQYKQTNAAYKQWQAIMPNHGIAAKAVYNGSMVVTADQKITIEAGLMRHGESKYEGVGSKFTLDPGVPQRIRLHKRFARGHGSIRLQIEVQDLKGGDQGHIDISEIFIWEAIESIRARLGSANINLKTANRLFREGDYRTALSLYYILSKGYPFQAYLDNALLTARRLGFNWVTSIDDIAQIVS